MEYIVLIPAYKPDMRMIQLLDRLVAVGLHPLVVNDGSGAESEPVFDEVRRRNIPLAVHVVNQGKGRALKTGLNRILTDWPEVKGVVTADCDGQHTVEDILKVLDAMRSNPEAMVIGAREFTGDVPFRSRFGNSMTSGIFWLATGIKLKDTQTGLRGIPACAIAGVMKLPGERYELEMNMLLKLRDWHMQMVQVPIETIYLDENASSHFNPIVDAWRIYKQIFGYVASSFVSWLVDYGLFLVFRLWFGWAEEICHAVARVFSAILNYNLNCKAVFRASGGKRQIVGYFANAAIILLIGMGGLHMLTTWGMNGLIAKIVVDTVLFFCNYLIQREFIFKNKKHVGKADGARQA